MAIISIGKGFWALGDVRAFFALGGLLALLSGCGGKDNEARDRPVVAGAGGEVVATGGCEGGCGGAAATAGGAGQASAGQASAGQASAGQASAGQASAGQAGAATSEDCEPETIDTRPCPDECGTQQRECRADRTWNVWGGCTARATNECIPGSPDLTRSCGRCGTQIGRCLEDCTYYWGLCDDTGGSCFPGEVRLVRASCPEPNQIREQSCAEDCRWVTGPCADEADPSDTRLVFTVVDPVEYEGDTGAVLGNAAPLRWLRGADPNSTAAQPSLQLSGAEATFATRPRFSSDGRWLAFMSDEGPFGLPELFVRDLADGVSRYVAVPVTPGQEVPAHAWLAGDVALAFIGDLLENDRHDLFVTRLEGDTFTPPVQVSLHTPPLDVDPTVLAPSATGQLVAYEVVSRPDGGRDLYVGAASGELAPVRVNTGTDTCVATSTGAAGAAGTATTTLDAYEVAWTGGGVLAFECSDPGSSTTHCLCLRSVARDGDTLALGPLVVTEPIRTSDTDLDRRWTSRWRWQVAPSAERLAYVTEDKGLCVASIAGGALGECVALDGLEPATRAWNLQWAPDGQQLIAAVSTTSSGAGADNVLWIRHLGGDAADPWSARLAFPYSAVGIEFPDVAWVPDGSARFILRNLVVDLGPLESAGTVHVREFRPFTYEDYREDDPLQCDNREYCVSTALLDHEFGRWAPDGGAIAYRECTACLKENNRSAQWTLWTVDVVGALPLESSRRVLFQPPLLNRVDELVHRPLFTAAGSR